ncbi:hypothetical protein E3V08_03785 [Candidatus Atribacteria bacterium MT.SAG.1]|nr:hypothetical protein E3V08_03785 [Candidatus Atribacteria bacterium MT.SAG.1]
MFDFWHWLILLEIWVRYLCMCFFWLGAIFILICWLKGNKGYEEEQKDIEEFAFREGLKEKKEKLKNKG